MKENRKTMFSNASNIKLQKISCYIFLYFLLNKINVWSDSLKIFFAIEDVY